MQKPYLTVIIPTYNRRAQLEKCLAALKVQTLNQEAFEIIVVNDGSPDDTKEFLDEIEKHWVNLTVLHQKNSGQGAARNLAIQQAQGQVVLFIGDDIYGETDFLQQHVDFHEENPSKEDACLGLTIWDPNQEINPFMDWLTSGGPQFAYHKLTEGQQVNFWFFYTSNISLKKELLEQHKFDSDFQTYGWEDIELAYRLEKEGMLISYKPAALAYHDHQIKESSLKKRMIGIGKNAKVFQAKHPELKIVPGFAKKIALMLIASWPGLILARIIGKRFFWYALSKRYFLEGLRSV